MKVKFIGVPGEDHRSIVMYGQTFPLGKYVDVNDPVAMRKLKNHPHFDSKDGPTDVAFKEPDHHKAAVLEKLAATPSRVELEALAAAVGVKPDGRWTDERLREEVEKAAG